MVLIDEIRNVLMTITLTFSDVLDIVLLTILIYNIIIFMKGNRAEGLFRGLIMLAGIYVISHALEMKAISFLLENAFSIGLLALMIVFQPEIRRTLERVGHSSLTRLTVLNRFGTIAEQDEIERNETWSKAIDEICEACMSLSSTMTGALIVLEQESKLGEQISTGSLIDAEPSSELFGNIFWKGAPLHDGAVIMKNGKLHAAGCYLPLPEKEETISAVLGTRHRAAIGMSEISDAVIVVVSEETGTISVVQNGKIERGYLDENKELRKFTVEELRKTLRKRIITKDDSMFISALYDCCDELSTQKRGAVIAIEGNVPLDPENSITINSIADSRLLCSIFAESSPLSEGAVTVKNGMIFSAGGKFAPTEKEEHAALDETLRIAIGITEISDASVLAVSPEDGRLYVAQTGTLTPCGSVNALRKQLKAKLTDDRKPEQEEMTISRDTVIMQAIRSAACACEELFDNRREALIIFEREDSLSSLTMQSNIINAETGRLLLESIFSEDSPLNSSAVVIRDGKILTAVSDEYYYKRKRRNDPLDRAKAAMSITEGSDAIAVVVSADNAIFIAENGGLIRGKSDEGDSSAAGFTEETLTEALRERLIAKESQTAAADEMRIRWENAVNAVADACDYIKNENTEAIAVIERDGCPENVVWNSHSIETVDAAVNTELLRCILLGADKGFAPDGAVIIREGRIYAVGCPVSDSMRAEGSPARALSKLYGSNAVIVSVENGEIHVSENGEPQGVFIRDTLKNDLRGRLLTKTTSDTIV